MKAYSGSWLYEAKRVNFGWYCDCRSCPYHGMQLCPLISERDPRE